MRKFFRRLLRTLIKIVILIIILSVGWVVLYKYVNPPITPLMIITYFEGADRIEKKWRGYDEISDYMKLAVIASEDQKFPFHDGFDVQAIEEAIDEKMKGERLRGASTISQQTAKNVFLWPERSWLRKGIEAYFTVLLEKIWGKERILEVYLNVIETGVGIYGVEEAGEIYFRTPANKINKEEAALIAATLPAPDILSAAHPSEYVRERQRWIIHQMGNLGGVSYLKNIK